MVSDVTKPISRPAASSTPTAGADFSCNTRNASSSVARWLTIGSGDVIASATRASGPCCLMARIKSLRPSTPTGWPVASATGNSFWLVRSKVSIASSIGASVESVANWVIIAAPIGTPRDMFIATRPGESVKDEVSMLVTGYQFKGSTEATVTVGAASFAMNYVPTKIDANK